MLGFKERTGSATTACDGPKSLGAQKSFFRCKGGGGRWGTGVQGQQDLGAAVVTFGWVRVKIRLYMPGASNVSVSTGRG